MRWPRTASSSWPLERTARNRIANDQPVETAREGQVGHFAGYWPVPFRLLEAQDN